MAEQTNPDPSLLREITVALSKADLLPAEHTGSYEALKKQLTEVIRFLLHQDFERLIGILYRIDVSEKAFKEILASPDPRTHAEQIAELVIERQVQKVLFRKKYDL